MIKLLMEAINLLSEATRLHLESDLLAEANPLLEKAVFI
jgi:hypothetical protein